jgi:hypothetical protein
MPKRRFHLARILRTEASEQWALVPCRWSWGLHIVSPFALFDVHYLADGGISGTLVLDRATLKRGRARMPTAEERHWLSALRAHFVRLEGAPFEVRVVEGHGGVLYWTEFHPTAARSYIDPDWKADTVTPGTLSHEFEFHLMERTPTSEVYVVWPCEEHPLSKVTARSSMEVVRRALAEADGMRLGGVHLHFERSGGLATILVEREIPASQRAALIDCVCRRLLRGCGRTFTLWVYASGKAELSEWTNPSSVTE